MKRRQFSQVAGLGLAGIAAPAVAQLEPHVLQRGRAPSAATVGSLEVLTDGGADSKPMKLLATPATIVAIEPAQLDGKTVTKVVVRYDKLTRN